MTTTVASSAAPTLHRVIEFRSRKFEASLESSMKNDAVMCVRMFSAIRRLPADEPFRQPPRKKTCVTKKKQAENAFFRILIQNVLKTNQYRKIAG